MLPSPMKRRRGRPTAPLLLDPESREKLLLMARRPKTAQHLALRARIVLRCAEHRTNADVAQELRCTMQTVGKWRERFIEGGIEALVDEPRPGAPRKITDAKVEEVVTQTLESTPRGQTHWSRRSMAKQSGLSADSVGRIWKAFGLKPHLSETFKLSPDPQFVEKVRDIVGLYLDPPEHAVVLCVDEKSQIQALDRTQPLLPLRPGQAERRTHDYVRHGTSTLFAALDFKTGEVMKQCRRQHRHQEFIQFLRLVEDRVPSGVDIHMVLDNYATHKTPAVRRWLAKRPHFHLHFTPTYASWINLVERLFAEVTDKAIRRGAFRSVADLERTIDAYLDVRNERPKPFVWTATADDILASVERFCLRTSRSGH
jgi:transposase